MRIVVDLQACQTENSRNRGVGRYSKSLATHMARLRESHDLRFCCNGSYQDAIEEVIDALDPSVPQQNISDYRYPPLRRNYPGERTMGVRLAETIVKQHWISLQPDVLHVSHIFEGFTGESVVPEPLPKVPNLLRSATLYDLIPLRFQETYLADPRFKQWYLEKLEILQKCDLLLAISDSSKKDAVELLGIDPDKVVTIWGGVDGHIGPREFGTDEIAAFRDKFKLRGRFVLYAGGDDHRKNIEGAIAGFSIVPREMRHGTQLAIVCAMQLERRTMYLERARKYGLGNDDIIFTGFVSEDDLVAFYNLCDVFVFPSLYEGFGLPILEAMACGAPAIGADNSSIREIIDRDDAVFDPQRPESIARSLSHVLSDRDFKNELRRYGLQRAKEFSWERSARLALNAFQDAHARFNATLGHSKASKLSRKKLALFSPLPPCRSGIADYNSAFLPFLSRYFDVELFIDDYEVSDPFIRANFLIRSHRDFPELAEHYDTVLYEMGNSEFHAYMLNYVERYPGVVGLHDAYLGGLYGYLEFYVQQSGRYFREMLYSHGNRARRYFAPIQEAGDPVGESMIKLPCTRRVIENATGLISHTPFNLEVASENYPEGWSPPYRIIKQMVRIPTMVGVEDSGNHRSELGFDNEDFIVCAFGHIVWTKYGDLLLNAFARSSLGRNPKAKLIFAGELARDDFGYRLEGAVKQSQIKERIRITGYLTEADYAKYLAVTNLAVQLRKNSRGGTPKGVLDCLAYGVPVIVNNDASYTDYPDDVVLKISPNPSVDELSAEFGRLYHARSELRTLGVAGRNYVEREHHPEKVAAQYAITLNEFIERGKAVSVQTRIEDIGAIIANSENPDLAIDEGAAALHHSLSRPLFKQHRILVDVSHISATDHETGIQRVVRSIVRWFYCSERAGFQPVAVRLTEDGLVEATEWLGAKGILSIVEKNADDPYRKIDLRPGDILLMIDSSWARIDEFLPVFEKVRGLNGKVYSVVYDLLPITLPHHFVPGGSAWFKAWLEKAVDHSDGLICISRSVADDVSGFVQSRWGAGPRRVRIGYWHLGADFKKVSGTSAAPTSRIKQALSTRPFLMVGLIEPRKRHALALDAMEILWAQGYDVSLCIAGKKGWMIDELMERIARHPELDKKLHFIDRPSDEELQYAYHHSSALLFPSEGEGFGLPLIEAAQFGTPIIASDIPVLREIAGEHATYFHVGSVNELAGCLEEWLTKAKHSDIPNSRNIGWLTWEQSAEQLLDVMLNHRWYKP